MATEQRAQCSAVHSALRSRVRLDSIALGPWSKLAEKLAVWNSRPTLTVFCPSSSSFSSWAGWSAPSERTRAAVVPAGSFSGSTRPSGRPTWKNRCQTPRAIFKFAPATVCLMAAGRRVRVRVRVRAACERADWNQWRRSIASVCKCPRVVVAGGGRRRPASRLARGRAPCGVWPGSPAEPTARPGAQRSETGARVGGENKKRSIGPANNHNYRLPASRQ